MYITAIVCFFRVILEPPSPFYYYYFMHESLEPFLNMYISSLEKLYLVAVMIPVDVTILTNGSCTKETRNNRSFDLLDVMGSRSSQAELISFT